MHTGSDPSDGSDCSSDDTSDNDIRNNSASNKDARDSSKKGSNPSTRMSAILHNWEGK